MFKSVRIQNFRQFKDLTLDNLAQINLITGKNDTGKTSLLEALFLLDGPTDPSRTVVVAQFRGIGGLTPGTRELWNWLFRNADTARPAFFVGIGRDGSKVRLAARLSRGSVIPAGPNGSAHGNEMSVSSLTSTEPLPALVYDFQEVGRDVRLIELAWTSQGLKLDPDLRPPGYQGFFLPDFHRPGHSEAVRLSQLVEKGDEGALIEALRVVEPRLKQLKVLDFGDGARVHADVGEYPLVPLSMMGQGFGKLLTIVASIVLGEARTYLIDEIGEGFHYSSLPDVWKVIVRAAVEHSAQVFATTHSYECIQAAVKGSEGHEDELSLIRLSRRDHDIRATRVEHEGIQAAIDFALELR